MVSKSWADFHFGVNYPFELCCLLSFIFPLLFIIIIHLSASLKSR